VFVTAKLSGKRNVINAISGFDITLLMVGNKMEIIIQYVDNIPVEKSGKLRILKNSIKHLLSE